MSKLPNHKLSDIQNDFLIIYKNVANVYSAMHETGITLAEFLDWRNEDEFDLCYREILSSKNIFLLEQNTLLTRERINEALQDGYVKQETINVEYSYEIEDKQRRKVYDQNGLSKNTFDVEPSPIVKVNKTVTKKPLTGAYLQSNGTENSIVKALQVLVQENVLPIQLARVLITTSSNISNQFLDIFTKDHQKDEKIENDKVIALIKAAVLGN